MATGRRANSSLLVILFELCPRSSILPMPLKPFQFWLILFAPNGPPQRALVARGLLMVSTSICSLAYLLDDVSK